MSIENPLQPQWTRSGPKQSIFDTNYIPTLWVQGDKASLDKLISTPTLDKQSVTLTFILANEIKTFQVSPTPPFRRLFHLRAAFFPNLQTDVFIKLMRLVHTRPFPYN